MHPARPLLGIVPVSLAETAQLDPLLRCLVSLWSTAGDLKVLVVDDASPAQALVDQLEVATGELGYRLERLPAPALGRAAAVNTGLLRALAAGQDAVVIDPGLEFISAGWLERMVARADTQGRPAAVVGARLVYGNGLLQHAGMFFSLMRREFFNRFRFGPGDLPEALRPCRCPVSQSLMLIRNETLERLGTFDEQLALGHEGLDYCLRAFDAGLECIYEPGALARHTGERPHGGAPAATEAAVGRSRAQFYAKHFGADLGRWVPEAI